jgi:argininosuccinate lyase
MSDKLWGGRFREATDTLVEALNASVDVDRRLYREDIAGSLAHATMLAAQGIIPAEDAAAILAGLRAVLADIEAGRFTWRVDREDVHMNVEAALHERIGPAAGRLHTARSRNDQVALDVRLWLRRRSLDLLDGLSSLRAALLAVAARHVETLLPGYTHLQRAQPVSLAHHLLAYEAMFARDHGRLSDAWPRLDVLPLGSGALAGTPFPIDRALVAALLGFGALSTNSQDAVAARDHLIEVVADCAIATSHLSRISEELVLWSSAEFGFVALPDAFCTGSSIMPQKKNPDVPELLRGQAARVTGDLVALLGLVKGLPLAYNKDLQEDKAPLFHAVDTLDTGLRVMAPLLRGLRVRRDRMRAALLAGHLTATDLADALAERGVPFREAHHVVGRLVAAAEQRGCALGELPADLLAAALPVPDLPLAEILSPERSVARRDVPGGPAPARVRAALAAARAALSRDRARVRRLRARLLPVEALLAG